MPGTGLTDGYVVLTLAPFAGEPHGYLHVPCRCYRNAEKRAAAGSTQVKGNAGG